MAALMTNAGLNEYVSSGFVRPTAIVQPACGTSQLGSDPHEDFVSSMSGVLDQVEGDLLDWYRNPERFADDETNTPSRDAVSAAMRFVQLLKDVSRLPVGIVWFPLRAVTIGSGGAISFEFAHGGATAIITFEPDGSVERMIFANGRLRSHADISSAQS